MDQTTLKVAFAAFVHGIDALIDTNAPVEDEMAVGRQGLQKSPGGPTPGSRGACAVIRRMIEEFMLPGVLVEDVPGNTDRLVDLAAGYQNPKTPMQWIIAMADELANGRHIGGPGSNHPQGIKTAEAAGRVLSPIFEHLLKDDSAGSARAGSYEWSYPTELISPENIFPVKTNGTGIRSGFLKVCEKFIDTAAGLAHREESPSLWFEHFESLVMAATSLISSREDGGPHSDVPLFDHLRMTSAFAVALYLYHTSIGELSPENIESIRNCDLRKFLIIGGDFYGIQNFIFNDSGEGGKNRSKILRGRSFAVSLFSELAADMLCRSIGIPSISVILNAAGRFVILAPNTKAASDAVLSVKRTVNDWFMKISYGEMALGISPVEASPRDFTGDHFGLLWEKLSRRMDDERYARIDLDRFGGTVEAYLKDFDRDLAHPLCPFCGKRPSSDKLEGCDLIGEAKSTCGICHDQIFLGTMLVKEQQRIAIIKADAPLPGGDSAELVEPIFGKYQIVFTGRYLNEMASEGLLLRYWDISAGLSGPLKNVTMKFINGFVPECTEASLEEERLLFGKKSHKKKEELTDRKTIGGPKTFDHIARMALNKADAEGEGFIGVEALGILKADLDHMGLLMSCGIPQDRFIPARLVALSRQVNWYFALYLPHRLKTTPEFSDIYTVFAGGDDLFLIGPWNRIIELAADLSRTFADYVCHNEKVHFSAGITLHKVHTPLDRLARSAELALSRSKDGGRDRITLFGETAQWGEFLKLLEIKSKLFEWKESKKINSAMLFRLNELAGMAEEAKRVLKLDDVKLEQLQCLKWRALFHYTAARNVGKDFWGEFSVAIEWLEKYGAQLRIALWDVIYNLRKGA
jgi:CRISPR-associated protein Csm1